MFPVVYRVTQTRLSVAAAGMAAAFAYLRRWPATRAIAQSSPTTQPADTAGDETVLDLMPAGPPHVVEVLADGTRRVVYGGLRATVRGAVVRWGAGEFAAAIRVAGRCPRGWIFVAADGAVARSDDFLSPLERLDDVPDARVIEPEATLAVLAPGRAMFSTYAGAWWTTDGRAAHSACVSARRRAAWSSTSGACAKAAVRALRAWRSRTQCAPPSSVR